MTLAMVNGPLVKFAGNAVRFSSDNLQILKTIETHFNHCIDIGESVVADYKIAAVAQDRFSAAVNGSNLFNNFDYETALQHLMRDALTQLNGVSETQLIFHAAALAYEGNAVMLCGQSGSSKSSLAAWLTAAGLKYLSDEVVAMPIDHQKISGLCRSIALKRGSTFIWRHWLKDQASDGFLKFKDDSAWIEPTLFNPNAIQAVAEPRILIFPHYHHEAEFLVKRITQAEALFRLLQNLVNARNFPDYGMAATSRLARRVNAYTLTYSDIETASTWIQQTIQNS